MNYFPKFLFIIILAFCISSCKDKSQEKPEIERIKHDNIKESVPKIKANTPLEISQNADVPDNWVEISSTDGFEVEIKYATTDNFTKKQIYNCGKCFLKPEAANKLKEINVELKSKYGYKLKVFDCYRPRPYQQKLWDIVPDPSYVTPPNKGSMHSRGLAVDLTLVDENGKELDMGTHYDFFGKEAHHDFDRHNTTIQQNRTILKSIMEKYGFKSIRTEWWHYSLNSTSYPLDNWVWNCD